MKKSILFMVLVLASTGLVQATESRFGVSWMLPESMEQDLGGCSPPSTKYCSQDCLRDLGYGATFTIAKGSNWCKYKVQEYKDRHAGTYTFVYDSHQPYMPYTIQQVPDLGPCSFPMKNCVHCVAELPSGTMITHRSHDGSEWCTFTVYDDKRMKKNAVMLTGRFPVR